MLPVVVLFGQPNVGKSTLFNRICGERISIVTDIPGVTRDRVSADAEWDDQQFVLVDTGGINLDKSEPLWEDIRRQAEMALSHCTAVVLVTSAQDGITPITEEAAHLIRTSGKPAFVAVNKAENKAMQQNAEEFHRLGIGDVFPISALHAIGIDDLMQAVLRAGESDGAAAEAEADAERADVINVAIVGKPNVGKSRIFNTITKEERSIVSEIAGTTRDAVDLRYWYRDKIFNFIDTAGIRRRGKINPGVEQYSVIRTLAAIERADVCLLLVAADDMVASQDMHIAGYVLDAKCAVVVVVNRWDLAPPEMTEAKALETIRDEFGFLPNPQVVMTNAHKLPNVDELLNSVIETNAQFHRQVEQYELSKVFASAIARKMPPSRGGVFPQFGRIRQAHAGPPSFEIEAEHIEQIHFSYRRYLENQLYAGFGFHGTPLKIYFKKFKR